MKKSEDIKLHAILFSAVKKKMSDKLQVQAERFSKGYCMGTKAEMNVVTKRKITNPVRNLTSIVQTISKPHSD
jgi:hypothetical protein